MWSQSGGGWGWGWRRRGSEHPRAPPRPLANAAQYRHKLVLARVQVEPACQAGIRLGLAIMPQVDVTGQAQPGDGGVFEAVY